MIKWIAIGAMGFLFSCNLTEKEPEVLISEVDGDEYIVDMEGEMNAKKATYLILKGKGEGIAYIHKRAISDSLHSNDSVWRLKYFEALNLIVSELDSIDIKYVGTNTFSYFLHYPQELLTQLENKAFDNSEIWLEAMAKEYQNRTAPDDITINSVINLAHKYCSTCSDEQKELIIEFVEMLSLYEE